MLRKVRIGLGVLILAFSISFLVWGYWPTHRELRVRPVSASPGNAALQERALTLLFPPKIRVGEPGVVRLTLEVDALKDLFSTAGGTDPSTFYDTHNLIAEARFDIPGIPIQPSDLISAPVSQGQTAVFYWTLRPGEARKFRGTVWLYLRAIDRSTGEERRETVSAQMVEIESVKFLGLTVNRVRIAGLVGAAVGLFLALPLFEKLAGDLYRKKRETLKIG
jgi:hypothetical protein